MMRGIVGSTLVAALLSATPALAQTAAISGPPMELDAATMNRLFESMKGDLRNLVTSQEAFFAEHAEYGTQFATRSRSGVQLRVSPGVTVTLTYVTKQTYAARTNHDWLPGRSCVMKIGTVAPSRVPKTAREGRSASRDGVPVCDTK